jgi:hypothetical protein
MTFHFDFSYLCKISLTKKGCMGLGVQLECTHVMLKLCQQCFEGTRNDFQASTACFVKYVVWSFIYFVGLAYQGKDIVFRFIIEYSSLRDFGKFKTSSR